MKVELISVALLWKMRKILLNGCLQAGAAVFLALSIKAMLDTDVIGGASQDVYMRLALLFFVVISCAILKWHERVLCESIGQNFTHDIRVALFDHLSRLSYSALKEQRKGPLLLRFMNDLTALRQWITIGLSRLLIASCLVLFSLPAMWIIHPYLGAVVTCVFTGAIIVALANGPGLNKTVRHARKRRSVLAARVTEKLMMVDVIQRMAARQIERRNVAKSSRRLAEAMVERAKKVGQLRALTLLASNLTIVMVAAFPMFLKRDASLTSGDILAGLTLVSFLTPALFDLGRVFEYWHGARLAAEKVKRVFKTGPLIEAPEKGTRKRVTSSRLRITGLFWGPVIQNVDLDARAGKRILITGENGSGKSTLLRLIMRMDIPDAGQIQLGRIPIEEFGLGNLRRTVALVRNEDGVFKGTVFDNLKYPKSEGITKHDAQLLKPLNLGFFKRSSVFFHTNKIAEFGQNLSQGERALLLLARALLRKPAILLIDEIDAHLDTENRDRLMAQLNAFSGTIIFVSHGKVDATFFDEHYVFNRGRLKKFEQASNPIIPITQLREVLS